MTVIAQPDAMNVKAMREVKQAFPSPIWIVDFPELHELNTALKRSLLDMEAAARRKGVEFGENYPNGYTTYFDNPRLFDTPPFDRLASYLFLIANDFAVERGYDMSKRELVMTQMFANVQHENSYHPYHRHQGSTISGVYYISAPENSGRLVLRDPNSAEKMAEPKPDRPNDGNLETLEITPVEGRTVMFPSYLDHMVLLHRETEPRIAASYNIRVVTAGEVAR